MKVGGSRRGDGVVGWKRRGVGAASGVLLRRIGLYIFNRRAWLKPNRRTEIKCKSAPASTPEMGLPQGWSPGAAYCVTEKPNPSSRTSQHTWEGSTTGMEPRRSADVIVSRISSAFSSSTCKGRVISRAA